MNSFVRLVTLQACPRWVVRQSHALQQSIAVLILSVCLMFCSGCSAFFAQSGKKVHRVLVAGKTDQEIRKVLGEPTAAVWDGGVEMGPCGSGNFL